MHQRGAENSLPYVPCQISFGRELRKNDRERMSETEIKWVNVAQCKEFDCVPIFLDSPLWVREAIESSRIALNELKIYYALKKVIPNKLPYSISTADKTPSPLGREHYQSVYVHDSLTHSLARVRVHLEQSDRMSGKKAIPQSLKPLLPTLNPFLLSLKIQFSNVVQAECGTCKWAKLI